MVLPGATGTDGRGKAGSAVPHVSSEPPAQPVSSAPSSAPPVALPVGPATHTHTIGLLAHRTEENLTLSFFSNACFLNCSKTELEAVERRECLVGGSSGLDTSRGGLIGGLLLRFSVLVGGAIERGGEERVCCERRPMISAADGLFNGAGCYGNEIHMVGTNKEVKCHQEALIRKM